MVVANKADSEAEQQGPAGGTRVPRRMYGTGKRGDRPAGEALQTQATMVPQRSFDGIGTARSPVQCDTTGFEVPAAGAGRCWVLVGPVFHPGNPRRVRMVP